MGAHGLPRLQSLTHREFAMPAVEMSIPAVLGERAREQPDTPAFTFLDYEVDPAGYAQSLTWSQIHRRVR